MLSDDTDIVTATLSLYQLSVLNYLDKGKCGAYWANTSSNSLVSKLLREGNEEIKKKFERLLQGEHSWCPIDEQIVYNQLDEEAEAV